MRNRFSSLNKSKTEEIYKELKQRFSALTEAEIDKEYKQKTEIYLILKKYTDAVKKRQQQYKILKQNADLAQNIARQARNRAINRMGVLETIGRVFSSDLFFSEEHRKASALATEASRIASSFKVNIHSNEIAERKKIFHELKVLREIRKKQKELNIRALANVKLKKVRATSATLKKKAIKDSNQSIDCPYCFCTFKTTAMVLDHIYPVSEGGLDTPKNTVLVCTTCNQKKSNLTLRSFAKKFNLNFERICSSLDKLGKKY